MLYLAGRVLLLDKREETRGRKLRGWCGSVGLALGFWVGRFFGWLVFATGILLSFFPLSSSFLYIPVYFWEPCSLLFNILLLSIKKKVH